MIGPRHASRNFLGQAAARPFAPPASSRLWSSRYLSRGDHLALEEAFLTPETVGPHTDLVREGAHADDLFIIVDGWACRYATTSDGGRQLSALLLPGDLGNLDSLMFDRLDYGVRTLTETTVVTLPRDSALALAAKHVGIGQTFTWLALLENAILTKWAQSLGRRPAKSRLAHLLCELSLRLDAEDGGESRFAFPLTQEQLADTLGLTAVHVNRVLQQLRLDFMVATTNRTMILPDVAGLRKACGFDPGYLHLALPHTVPGNAGA